ncbi:hypothetical protein D1AOALGA4SA_9660 [Olavius algarvensis Delta 1 endosymbiont]|nr:hypothetical protein D1AOALGA4SA_9660 [Olavius algarvensis Delta 1 endosymbiont]
MKKQFFIIAITVWFIALAAPGGALEFEFLLASKASFNLPHDLALSPDGRLLYVADNGNDRIAVVNPDTLEVIGTIGEAELSTPHDAAFDSRGRLLVADTGNDRVVVYRLKGVRGEKVAVIKGGFDHPEGVATYPGQRIYVSGARSDNLVAFENGVKVSSIGGLAGPHDVETDEAGNILVVDSNNNRLLFLTPDLQIKKVMSGAPFNFNGPRYAVYDAEGRIYVADKYAHMIKVIGNDDRLVGTLGTGQAGKHPDRLNKPEGVAVRGRDVWISDTYNHRILRYRVKK